MMPLYCYFLSAFGTLAINFMYRLTTEHDTINVYSRSTNIEDYVLLVVPYKYLAKSTHSIHIWYYFSTQKSDALCT